MASRRIKALDIPVDEQGTLANVLRLTDPDLDGLERALARIGPTLDRAKLASELRAEHSLSKISDLEEIIGTLVNITATAYSAGVSIDDILDAVVNSIRGDDVVELTDADAGALKSRLARLAKSKSIELIAKGSELLQANERTFFSARVVSDLRMVCLGEDTDVSAAVIVHQLAITSSHNGRRETTHVVLDSLDLESLEAVIARATKKDQLLRDYAKAAGTPIMSPAAE